MKQSKFVNIWQNQYDRRESKQMFEARSFADHRTGSEPKNGISKLKTIQKSVVCDCNNCRSSIDAKLHEIQITQI